MKVVKDEQFLRPGNKAAWRRFTLECGHTKVEIESGQPKGRRRKCKTCGR